jgi:DNA modification methylase
VPNKDAGATRKPIRRRFDGRLRSSPPLAVLPRRPIGSVLPLPNEKSNRGIARDHPAVFPPSLPQAYIDALTDPGDIVVDPFLGSGSTLIACELTGRVCYGLEIEPRYCDIARARYQALVDRHSRKNLNSRKN